MKIQNVAFVVIIIFTSCSLLSASPEKKRVITNPSYEVTTSGQHEISRIELSETETRIYLHSILFPDWWVSFSSETFIEDPNTDKKYMITDIEGANFDELIEMEASGENTTVLIFPPLDEDIKKINYNDIIYGLSLVEDTNGKDSIKDSNKIPEYVSAWIKTELAKASGEPLSNLNSDKFFKKGKGRIIGYLKGYDPRLGFKTGIIYADNEITREDYPVVIEIHPDGRFEANVPLIHPVYSHFLLNKQAIPFYLEPGQTLAVVLNWEEFLIADRKRNERHLFKDIDYQGKLTKINTDLLGFDLKNINYPEVSDKVKNSSPEDFKKAQLAIQKDNTIRLNAYLEANTISLKAATLLQGKNLLQSGTRLFDFLDQRGYEKRQDTLNEVLKSPVPDNYYDFLKKIPLNDQSLVALEDFGVFVNRFEFSEPLKKVKSKSKFVEPELTLLEYFDERGISLTEEERKLQQPVNEPKMPEFFQKREKQRQLFYKKYKNEITSYVDKYIKPVVVIGEINIDFMAEWEQKDSVLTTRLGLKNDLVYDVIKIRSLNRSLGIFLNRKGANTYWTKLQATIENEFLKQEGERMLREVFPELKENPTLDTPKMNSVAIKSNNIPLPKGKATNIFRKIVAPYIGKIIFVDFWATSCGPCIATIKSMKETRKKFKDNKDFEFVFITDERQSPLSYYTKFVKEQELKNIHRIGTDDYNYLRQLFSFNGIPRYVVIDKEGNLIDGNFHMHQFQNKLQKILDENK